MHRVHLLLSLATLCLPLSLSSQKELPRYIAGLETTLSATADKQTIQQPSSPSKTIFPKTVTVYCSVACDIQFSWNGTAASTTAMVPRAYPGSPTPTAKAFSASNAGTGTLGLKFSIPAAGTAVFSAEQIFLSGTNGLAGVNNFSVAVASITGTWRPAIEWTEQ